MSWVGLVVMVAVIVAVNVAAELLALALGLDVDRTIRWAYAGAVGVLVTLLVDRW